MKYRYDTFNRNKFESHKLAESLIRNNTRVLDIGCATGYFARELLRRDCETWGIDGDKQALTKARQYCHKVFWLNFDEAKTLPVPKKYFDTVIILDVIEHLRNPEHLLSLIRTNLKRGGRVVVSVPNIAHASIRWMLLTGQFLYTETGILDKTHVHFYTLKSFRELLYRSGYEIIEVKPTNGTGKVPFLYKITDRLPVTWQYQLVKFWPSLFAFQFVALVKPMN